MSLFINSTLRFKHKLNINVNQCVTFISNIFVIVFKTVAKFLAKHQDLFEYIEDGSKSAGLRDSKVTDFLPNIHIKSP